MTSNAQPMIFSVFSLRSNCTFCPFVKSTATSVFIGGYPWLKSLPLHQPVFKTVHERLQAGFDDIIVHPHCAPLLFAIGGFDEDASARAGAGGGIEDAHLVIG